MFTLGAQQWGIYRQGECKGCRPMSQFRDRFAALQWLQQFKGNALSMSALRHMLSREGSVAWRVDTATDDEIIEQAAQLLGFGIWHVHEPVKARQIQQTQGPAADQPVTKGAGSSDPAVSQMARSQPGQSALPGESRAAKPGSAPPAAAKKLTWIEIKLVDAEGEPVPGMKYEIRLPDGSVRPGTLDFKGTARHEQIVPGQCAVRFPELDAHDWGPA